LISPGAADGRPATFTGYADPSNGLLVIIPESGSPINVRAALGTITEDSNGKAYAAATNTVEVFAETVNFTSNPAEYPTNCDPAAPAVMWADVYLTSGYQIDQLRNLFAKITSTSAGVTFCNHDTNYPPEFDTQLGSTALGLSVFGALDPLLSWPQTWGINLTSENPFWFTGQILSEVFAPSRITGWAPAAGAKLRTNNATRNTFFTWNRDLTADGSNDEAYVFSRPTQLGRLTIWKCTQLTGPNYNNGLLDSDCVLGTWNSSLNASGQFQVLDRYFWYKWSYQESLVYDTGVFDIGSPSTRVFSITDMTH
jgi:hypothetical protein